MSEKFGGEQPMLGKRLFPIHYWLVLLIIAAGAIYYTLSQQPRFVNPKIASKPYVWPEGCEKKDYAYGDFISESCRVAKYAIPEWKQYGWRTGFRSTIGFDGFFRIGNDAVSFYHCDLDQKDHCQIYNKISDVFVISVH